MKAFVRMQLFGGPHDGDFVQTGSDVFDVAETEPTQAWKVYENPVQRPRLVVSRYRMKQGMMKYEGQFLR